MKILNFKSRKFAIGKSVIVINEYTMGSLCVTKGDIGKIVSAKLMSVPDMGLFDIRVVDFKFSNCTLSMSESVAEEYMKVI